MLYQTGIARVLRISLIRLVIADFNDLIIVGVEPETVLSNAFVRTRRAVPLPIFDYQINSNAKNSSKKNIIPIFDIQKYFPYLPLIAEIGFPLIQSTPTLQTLHIALSNAIEAPQTGQLKSFLFLILFSPNKLNKNFLKPQETPLPPHKPRLHCLVRLVVRCVGLLCDKTAFTLNLPDLP